MPTIRSIDILADGVRIVTTDGAAITVTSADVPGSVHNIADGQAWLDGRLPTLLTARGYRLGGRPIVTSLSPLVISADWTIGTL